MQGLMAEQKRRPSGRHSVYLPARGSLCRPRRLSAEPHGDDAWQHAAAALTGLEGQPCCQAWALSLKGCPQGSPRGDP